MPFSHPGAKTEKSIEVWHRAFDLGMTLINTADAYAPSAEEFGHNEKLVAKAVDAYGRNEIFVVTKVGHTRNGDDWGRDNRPEYLLAAAQASNDRLGWAPDAILVHRLDRSQPLEITVEALLEIKNRGLAEHVGISNLHHNELSQAWVLSDGEISFVENERSPRYREDSDVVKFCNLMGIAYLAWSPLGGGKDAGKLGRIFPEFAAVGEKYEASAQEVALAWLLTHGPAVTPIPAFTRSKTADSAATAAFLALDEEDLELLNNSAPGPGSLYPD